MPNNNNVSKYYKNESLRRRRLRNLTKRLHGTTRGRRPRTNGPSPLNPKYKRKNTTVENILRAFSSNEIPNFYE